MPIKHLRWNYDSVFIKIFFLCYFTSFRTLPSFLRLFDDIFRYLLHTYNNAFALQTFIIRDGFYAMFYVMIAFMYQGFFIFH